jgi:Mn2+/Fe2+ NRAMP family transporter
VKKLLQISLGIVTSVGGFLEIGSVMTAAQAGAAFGYQLLWALLLGTLCLIFLVEMSGRLAAVSQHTIVDAMRERFGFPFFFIVLVGMVLIAFMVLVAELGGIGLSLQLLTGRFTMSLVKKSGASRSSRSNRATRRAFSILT